jgi:hypothetical protein
MPDMNWKQAPGRRERPESCERVHPVLAAGGLRRGPPSKRDAGLLRPVPGTENGWVSPAIEWVIVILLPTAGGYALIGGGRLLRWAAERRRVRRYRLDPPLEPIERLAARLRRLRVQLAEAETTADLPGKHIRLTALRAAYVDVLSAACERLEVPAPPGGGRAPLTEIYRAEDALRRRGLDVRQPAPR